MSDRKQPDQGPPADKAEADRLIAKIRRGEGGQDDALRLHELQLRLTVRKPEPPNPIPSQEPADNGQVQI